MGLTTLFGRLFGGGGESASAQPAEAVEYKGFTITATPIQEGGQYRTAGSISREIDGELHSAQFIRADNHSDRQSAVTHSERKAQQIIDEQGDRLFERDHI
ncbi:MAG: hypothetical protein HKN42_18350 [Granulosicoccus sp.]|nr:hypothetical protein [Granulosicoccus sp.]